LPDKQEAQMAYPKLTVLLFGVLIVTSAGCRGQPEFTLAPVEGTVTKGGKPLAGVIVEFCGDPDFATLGPRSRSAVTDEAGHYQLQTAHGDDGAVVGRHRVCVLDTRAAGAALSRALGRDKDRRHLPENIRAKLKDLSTNIPAPARSRIKPNYGRLNETPLRVEVQPGNQVINLKVE
jgi:hypothetical protein